MPVVGAGTVPSACSRSSSSVRCRQRRLDCPPDVRPRSETAHRPSERHECDHGAEGIGGRPHVPDLQDLAAEVTLAAREHDAGLARGRGYVPARSSSPAGTLSAVTVSEQMERLAPPTARGRAPRRRPEWPAPRTGGVEHRLLALGKVLSQARVQGVHIRDRRRERERAVDGCASRQSRMESIDARGAFGLPSMCSQAASLTCSIDSPGGPPRHFCGPDHDKVGTPRSEVAPRPRRTTRRRRRSAAHHGPTRRCRSRRGRSSCLKASHSALPRRCSPQAAPPGRLHRHRARRRCRTAPRPR